MSWKCGSQQDREACRQDCGVSWWSTNTITVTITNAITIITIIIVTVVVVVVVIIIIIGIISDLKDY